MDDHLNSLEPNRHSRCLTSCKGRPALLVTGGRPLPVGPSVQNPGRVRIIIDTITEQVMNEVGVGESRHPHENGRQESAGYSRASSILT